MDSTMTTPSRRSAIPRPSRLPTRLPKPTAPPFTTRASESRGTVGREPARRTNVGTIVPSGGQDEGTLRTQSIPESPVTEVQTSKPKARRPRPSLSDRTIETLTSIPPSPSPARRRSSFFTAQSPMASPVRPSSAMHSHNSSFDRASVASRALPQETAKAPYTSAHLNRPRSPVKSARSSMAPREETNEHIFRPPSAHAPKSGLVSMRAPPKKSNISGSQNPTSSSNKTRLGRPTPSVSTTPRRSGVRHSPGRDTPRQAKTNTTDAAAPKGTDHSPKSSAALRETIARAKAAHRAVSGPLKGSPIPAGDSFPVIEVGGDNGALSKRIALAREKGQLNIPNMGLTRLPTEILSMYDANAFDTFDGSWAESVDLVKVNAADNEISQIDERFLPPQDSDEEENQGSFVLATVETLDLHGNQLSILPKSLDRLESLVNLNLSRNSLGDGSLGIITRLHNLRELRLASNKFSSVGEFDFAALANLELLDISNNALSSVPATIVGLEKLHTLVLSGNKLSSLPGDIFQRLQLRDLQVARNGLKGTLLPAAQIGLKSLRAIDASHNALTCLSAASQADLPNLRTLNIAQNRLKTLPDLSLLHCLITIAADGNQLIEIPASLLGLLRVKNVDLSRNDIRQVDPRVGMMPELTILSIADNPIRERKLLNMNTADLKQELRSRLEGVLDDEDTDNEQAAQDADPQAGFDLQPGGMLDLSSSKLETLDDSWAQKIANGSAIKSLVLSQNLLRLIPVSIRHTRDTLTSLDLSQNKLPSTEYIAAAISLPRLRSLNIAANSIETLAPLLRNLKAEFLNEIDVSRNRLTALPILRSEYPRLSTVKAADNRISELPFDSVQGLQVLDVTANDINALEPRIGVLSRDGLRVFLVGANTFRVPRRDIVEKGTEAILNWLRGRIPAEEEVETF